jgi:hypothetical protein
VLARRLLPLCLVVPGLVLAGAAPALAHGSPAHFERTALAAAPSEDGKGVGMSHVANLQYEPLADGRGQNGSDIEFLTVGEKDYALAGTLRNGLQIVDITAPASPSIAAVYQCPINQGDVQIFRQGSRILATYTADSRINTDAGFAESQCVTEANELGAEIDGSEAGTFLVDLTDPTAPSTVSFIEIAKGSHNQTVHPSGDYLYNSNSDLIINSPLPQITIHDISIPSAPRFVQHFRYPPASPNLGEESHDIFFKGDGTRAYVASLASTLILDTTNPEAPSIISQFDDPANSLVHQSDLVSLPRQDGTVRDLLITTDEQAGALPQSTCPGGGLHVYDITGEKERNPLANKQGTWFIPVATAVPGETCTSHVLRIHPDQQMLTIAWYAQGVRTLDISGLAEVQGNRFNEDRTNNGNVGMKEVGSFFFPEDSDTWSFKTNRIAADGSFFGYGNDIARGLDVFRFDGELVDGRTVPPLEPTDLAAEGCSGVPVASAYGDRDEARAVHQRSVDCVIARFIAQGKVEEGQRFYGPLEDVTRGQMATFLVNTLRASGFDGELPEPGDADAFGDIADSAHRDSINVLAEAGVVRGVTADSYDPGATVSRQQMASFLVRTANLAEEPDLSATRSGTFTDVPAGSTHADSIQIGADNGLFSGTGPTTFAPAVDVKRDQMASFLTNLLTTLGDVQVGPPVAGAFEG